MTRPSRPVHGFTLIELLIVVAIIAILAAIAVPNFLEAQTRSKVSRVRADMRSMATGLEAYVVDHNRYPPDFTDVLAGKNPPRYNTFVGRLSHLTTPISYLSNLFVDIFAEPVATGSATKYDGSTLSTAPYRVGGVSSGAIIRPITYDYAKYDRAGYPVGVTLDSPTVWSRISGDPSQVAWALNSPGPDVTFHDYLGFPNFQVYDPTNGTISIGQIIRTNLGSDDQRKTQ